MSLQYQCVKYSFHKGLFRMQCSPNKRLKYCHLIDKRVQHTDFCQDNIQRVGEVWHNVSCYVEQTTILICKKRHLHDQLTTSLADFEERAAACNLKTLLRTKNLIIQLQLARLLITYLSLGNTPLRRGPGAYLIKTLGSLLKQLHRGLLWPKWRSAEKVL